MTTDDRKLVLVVDADPGFVEQTRTLVAGHRTLTARDLSEAREIVLGGRVDVVVLGPAFASEHSISEAAILGEADPTARMVVVADIVTNRLLKAALRAGFADVIDAPLTTEGLAAVLPVGGTHTPPAATEIDLVVEAPDGSEVPIQATVPAPHHPSQYSPEPAETLGSGNGWAAPVVDRAGNVPVQQEAVTPAVDSVRAPVPEAAAIPVAGQAPAPETVTETPQELPVAPMATPVSPELAPAAAPIETHVPVAVPAPPAPDRYTPSESAGVPDPASPPAPAVDVSGGPVWPDESPVSPPPAAETSSPLPPVPDVAPPSPASGVDTAPRPPEMPPPSIAPPGAEAFDAIPASFGDGPAPRPPSSGPGRVIAVMAGKGGSGKSVIATNLAVALGMRHDPERVAIVDADLQFGDVALMLQIDPVRTIDDVVGQLDSLTDARLDAALLRHESGLRVLPAPLTPVRHDEITAKSVVEIVERLRGIYDTIVVDTGPVFGDGLVTILEHADAVVAVVDMDLPSVKNSKVALDTLRSAGFPMERITLVVNRVNSKARLDLIELERSLGLRVGGSVPSDRLVPQSVNEGIPLLALSPRSKVARSFMALAEQLDPTAERARLGGGGR
jgi:MinD-like ATPase involved in chromosome partitioning or flagellar assembly